MSNSTSLARRLGLSVLLAAATVVGLATSAFAGSQVPFDGSFTEAFNFYSPPPIVASGAGNIQHLGLSTESSLGNVSSVVDSKTGCNIDSSTSTITGAAGDTVNVSAQGEFCVTAYVIVAGNVIPTAATDSGTFTITGGTGKYNGASGSGTYSAALTIDPATGSGTSVETYNGTISSPGSL